MAVITYFSSFSEKDFDAEKLALSLYPWQMRKFFEQWDEKDDYIAEKLKSPDSPLHQIIRNGIVREYHENNQLKHEAFYINDKVDGKSLEWYDNGELKYEQYYNKGKRRGVWKEYYSSGNIRHVQPFNDDGRYDGDLTSYYENGRIRRMSSMKDGKNVDGYINRSWFENGKKESELKYADGQIVERKNWAATGQIINHEIYDKDQKKLIKKALTETVPQNNQNSKQDSGEINLGIIRERQYPKTNWSNFRLIALLLLIIIQLLRMCK